MWFNQQLCKWVESETLARLKHLQSQYFPLQFQLHPVRSCKISQSHRIQFGKFTGNNVNSLDLDVCSKVFVLLSISDSAGTLSDRACFNVS